MGDPARKTLDSSRQYTVAWLAALPSERAAAEILLDEEHEKPNGFIKNFVDTNSYTWGRMGKHNVVISSLPSGEYGTVVTADMTGGLRASLPHIRVGLLVGIAAGVTGEKEEPDGTFSIDRDIRLGDIAVSNPDKANGGVVQYDLYKAEVRKIDNPDGSTTEESYGEAKGFVNAPARALRSALAALQAKHEYEESRVAHHLQRFKKNKKTRTFAYPGILNAYDAVDRDGSDIGDEDDEDQLRIAISEKRATLRSGTKLKKLKRRTEPVIHYGTIASGDALLKNKADRDGIISRLKANNVEPICFEMEAAGIMGSFPSLVIRGICDYGNEQKNDAWQKYAAATAAAFAKEFLEYLDAEEVEQEPPIRQFERLVEQLTETVEKHVVDYQQQQMTGWLSPPDPSTNYNKAKGLRHPETGRWFLQSERYKKWQENTGSPLWLHGLAGCGKTVLSSTIIGDLQESSSDNIVLYFFFDFNNTDKRSFEKMLRSLIFQMYQQCIDSQKHFDNLYSTCRSGGSQPDTVSLITVFQSMLAQSEEKIHVMLDALDECDSNIRMELLIWLHSVPRNNIHLALTSRQEHDIEVSLIKWIPTEAIIPIQNKLVDEDIRAVIRSRLEVDEHLKRWQSRTEVCEEIETKLMEKADGMFRWAVCQLDALRTCLDLPSLRTALASLPRDLVETYSRILLNIEREGHRRNAVRLLQFLTYTDRPLRLEEAVDVLAVNLDINNCESGFEEQNRMPNPNEIVRYCSGLVRLTSRVAGDLDFDDICRYYFAKGTIITELQLAHFSVKEYLVSKKVEETFKQSLSEVCSRTAIVEVNISYILAASCNHNYDEDNSKFLPLSRLSTTSWMGHFRKVEAYQGDVVAWINKLFTMDNAYRYWLQFYDPYFKACLAEGEKPPNPLYYASLFGFTESARHLIDQGSDVDAEGGEYGYALHAASLGGFQAVVQLLLDRGADFNAQGGEYGSALYAASTQGHQAVIQLLLDRGADINAQGRKFGYALHAASLGGEEATVQLLLDRGADINAQGGLDGSALHAASTQGHYAVVELLLDRGADVNAQGGEYGYALHAASHGGYQAILQLLLDRGAEVNGRGGYFGSAIASACHEGHHNMVKMLLDRGADVDTQAIYFASEQGHDMVVQLLLDRGADANSQNNLNDRESVLSAASRNGHEKVVQILLNAGAKVNAVDDEGRNALQLVLAFRHSHKKIVQMLLDAGADVNAKDSDGSTTLQQAVSSSNGYNVDTVRMLLDAGAEVDARDHQGRGALHRVCCSSYPREGLSEILETLLNAGADLNAVDSNGLNALYLASDSGQEGIVQKLLDAGAALGAVDSKSWDALKIASNRGRNDIVQLLLDAEADFNAKDESLKLASQRGHKVIVQLLLGAGAQVNANDKVRTALQLASKFGHKDVVQLLLDAGADVNAAGNGGWTALQRASKYGHKDVVQLLLDAERTSTPLVAMVGIPFR